MKKVHAVYDIGKTNKKFFLFDNQFKQIYGIQCRIVPIVDEDGFECDDLEEIEKWIESTFIKIVQKKKFAICSINFSSYGASFVHVDIEGRPLTPLYNYLKPYPQFILSSFYRKYGPELKIARQTASPPLAMLNSGLQLYWLKKTNPVIFNQIKYSLHLPQYLSFLFSQKAISEYTSIGCHTALWNYKKQKYHKWIAEEDMLKILPPIVKSSTSCKTKFMGHKLKIGAGIHDSSAALVPYLRMDKNPFLLLSTGTWNIALHPFNDKKLSKNQLENDCLNYMSIDGQPVKASRLFLGHEYATQIVILLAHFGINEADKKEVRFDKKLSKNIKSNLEYRFKFKHIPSRYNEPKMTNLEGLTTFKEAVHHLLIELMEQQVMAINRIIKECPVKTIYVEGGFSLNKIFVGLLALYFKKIKIKTSQSSNGSALGAALVISKRKVKKNFLKKQYNLKKYIGKNNVPS